ncbi:hypothetical protein D0911_17385 [Zhongshania marina]|uniref:Phage integrase family protein n=1 Tax=Zhongshania marina TaxID=2304603 RepID=A0ABX9VZ62_9GAMM|nr:hypothetical protein D0911_17385 [Zhongshania marina]
MNESELATLNKTAELKGRIEKDILAYGASLLTRLAAGEFGAPPDDKGVDALSAYGAAELPSNGILNSHLQSIKSIKKVEACIVSCMLCARPLDDFFDTEKHERITAWSLLACIALNKADQEGYQGIIQEGARRVRLMTTAAYQWMYSLLPEFNQPIEDTYAALAELMTRLSENINHAEQLVSTHERNSTSRANNITEVEAAKRRLGQAKSERQFIGQIYSLFGNYSKTLSPGGGRRGGAGDANDSDQAAVSVAPVVGLEDDKLRFLEWIEKGKGGHGSIAAAELNRDRPIGTKYIEPTLVLPKSINRSRVLAHFRASTMVNRIAMRNMANPCDWGVLTWFEATTFVQAAAAKLDTNKAAALGLLMLLAGRSTDRAKSLVVNIRDSSAKERIDTILFRKDRVGLQFQLVLPSPIGAGKAPQLLKQVKNTITLRLPHCLLEPLRGLRGLGPEGYDSLEAELKSFLGSLNKEYNLRLTIPRLCGFLRSQMRRRLDDPADASLICGETSDQCPALYYYAIVPERIVKEYRDWVTELMAAADVKGSYPSEIQSQNALIGSNTQFDVKHIKSLFKHLAKSVAAHHTFKTKDYKSFHNAYMLYVYEVLCLAVGYRAVISPLENIKDFDLIRRLLWISDKESHNGLAARTVPLTQLAVDVIEAAIRHIERLAYYLKPYEPPMAEYLIQSVHGESPFLSMFDSNDKLTTLRPSILTPVLNDKWPFALNWQRHFMRSKLRESGVPGDVVNAWMGHSDFGEEAFGPWSGLSIADLRQLEVVMQTILSELGIAAIEGWQR